MSDRVDVRLRDVAELRAAATTGLPDVDDGARALAVRLRLDDDPGALSLVPRPEWPPLKAFRSVPKDGGRLTVVRFGRPVSVVEVLRELGLQAVWPATAGEAGLLITDRVPEPEALVPDAVAVPGGLVVDERVFNPIGFLVEAPEPEVDVASLGEVGPADIARLRSHAGVRVTRWDEPACRAVVRLACAGVPVVADSASRAPDLPASVAMAITAPVDLADPLAREEHSVVLRRAALEACSSSSWRADVVRGAGQPVAGQPSVSIVLATKRAEMLDFALAQIARQRGVDQVQLVLAPHGFEVDAAQVRAAVPGIDVVLAPAADQMLFGDVLQTAAEASSGDLVLKMDDDDWYAPDAIADLVRARRYSGAELVGMPPEFHYLAERDLTVKRGHPVECYASFVAGGTMLIERDLLREVGGFRSTRRFVDAQLLDAVLAAGGAIYRTHGLGYLLRRNATGHTWQADLDFLLDPSRVAASWPGLRPSRLMELEPNC
ncbi:glycosyltransferase family 2 protein [Nocardioides sp. R-C-SC26]|uniref:glycosyltransferase n=1 Tax=Nocardioides sp. R-C-SC26 TaxID=2870414 RepID=UPI001E3BA2FD|nr:glycosyltransferase [Nocardioides sp. R-C-SC26]